MVRVFSTTISVFTARRRREDRTSDGREIAVGRGTIRRAEEHKEACGEYLFDHTGIFSHR